MSKVRMNRRLYSCACEYCRPSFLAQVGNIAGFVISVGIVAFAFAVAAFKKED